MEWQCAALTVSPPLTTDGPITAFWHHMTMLGEYYYYYYYYYIIATAKPEREEKGY